MQLSNFLIFAPFLIVVTSKVLVEFAYTLDLWVFFQEIWFDHGWLKSWEFSIEESSRIQFFIFSSCLIINGLFKCLFSPWKLGRM